MGIMKQQPVAGYAFSGGLNASLFGMTFIGRGKGGSDHSFVIISGANLTNTNLRLPICEKHFASPFSGSSVAKTHILDSRTHRPWILINCGVVQSQELVQEASSAH